MSDSKKPKLSEVYSLLASSRPLEHKEGVNAILCLLSLVRKLGEALEHLLSQSEIAEFNNMSGTATCELCSEVGETMPTIPHKPDCAVKEARALLLEVKE